MFKLLMCAVSLATAHSTGPHSQDSWFFWSGNTLVLVSLAVFTTLYSLGLKRLPKESNFLGPSQIFSFYSSIVVLVIALLSPLDTLSEELGFVHMIQHMSLMMIAAPLFVYSGPGLVFPRSLSSFFKAKVVLIQRRFWKFSGQHPFVMILISWLLFAFVLWVWHLPQLYEAALNHRLIHDFQHLGFFLSSALYWHALLDPIRKYRINWSLGVLFLFTTSLHAALLGFFMALAPTAWYPTYSQTAPTWGLDPLSDQQIAGFLMWMPACMVYVIVAAVMFTLWLRKERDKESCSDIYTIASQ